MRYGWAQHLDMARTLGSAGSAEQGTALALMGVALLMLAEDLLTHEIPLAIYLDDAVLAD